MSALSKTTHQDLPQHIASDHLAGLAEIYREDINLAIWQRSIDDSVQQAVQALCTQSKNFSLSEIVTPENVSKALERSLPDTTGRSELIRDIALLVDAYCCLFELDTAGLRLTQVDKAMCPRFHVDHVPCRLITTYSGPATQWLSEDHINRQKLGRGSGGKPDSHSGLIHRDAQIQQLNVGDVALLKGERWEGNEGFGAVHRSPAVEAGQTRLLMTLDMA